MLVLSCPKCKNTQNCQPLSRDLANKKKRCVYCGHNFRVRERIVKEI